jgi:L-ascorbate metabolism protein UlaG (beta-lactamase superfamily)
MNILPSFALFESSHAWENTMEGGVRLEEMGLREAARKKLHHGEGHFVNPFNRRPHGNLWPVISWKLFSKNRFKHLYEQEPTIPVTINWEPIRRYRGLSLTYVTHAAVMIKDLDHYLLIDPIFSGLGWFFKDFTPLHFPIKEMPRPDHVLITHGHYDHLDKPSLASLDKKTHIITPLGYRSVFTDLGMQNRTQLDWFDALEQGNQRIMLLPCNHWTMRNPMIGPNRSLWGSFLIETAAGPTIFVSGDSAYFEGFREIGNEFSIDLAIINVGAYEPRWFMASSHMNPPEAVQAFQDLRAKYMIIVHWGSFRLGDEPVHFPPAHVEKEMEKRGLAHQLIRLTHGHTLCFNQSGQPCVKGMPDRTAPSFSELKGIR